MTNVHSSYIIMIINLNIIVYNLNEEGTWPLPQGQRKHFTLYFRCRSKKGKYFKICRIITQNTHIQQYTVPHSLVEQYTLGFTINGDNMTCIVF